MTAPRIILASASPRRRELLRLLGRTFQAVASDAPELSPGHMTPIESCQLNAYRKARLVAKRHPDAVVIGADTEVCLGRKVFGKPASFIEACVMLRKLQGKVHQVVTGVCLLHLRRHRQACFAELTHVKFHRLTRDQREGYLKRINPLDKAGAYAVQEFGHLIIEAIDGSFTNVVGLPVDRLRHELNRFLAQP
jgi:septum formation protein